MKKLQASSTVSFLLFASFCFLQLTSSAQFINRMEYFFDVDPGVGNGTQLTVSVPADSITLSTTISTTGLQPGIHNLFIRAKQATGVWSLYQPQEFYVKQPMVQAEYFFDTDPGLGNATAITITQGIDSSTIASAVSTTGLTPGYHVLFIRTRDNKGFWSLYQPREFFIHMPLVAAEYFFDTDPGTGNGISLAVTPGIDSTIINSTISTTGVGSGNHVLFVRTKDQNGKWSLYQPREFNVKSLIMASEYFIDTDPGVGNGIPMPVGTPSDSVTFNGVVTTGALPFGNHFLFVRTKDQKGVWSLYEPQQFTTGSPLPVEWISFDAICNGANADLTWVTGSELNCQRFDVERMLPENGNEFYKIGEVDGNGTTSLMHTYTFTDENVKCNGVAYYRIKQIDFDGQSSYTKTVTVRFEQAKTTFKIYPNPSSSIFTLDFTGEPDEILNIELYSPDGQLISREDNLSFPYRFGENLQAGQYLVAVRKQTETVRFKIIKVN